MPGTRGLAAVLLAAGVICGPVRPGTAHASLVVTNLQFNGGAAQRSTVTSIGFVFNEGLASSSVTNASLTLLNLNSNLTIGSTNLAVTYDATTNRLTWTFPGLTGGSLPDGNYSGVLSAAGLISTNGDLLAADYTFTFFRYFGDSEGDRDVDFADFFAFARTYGLSTGNTNFNAAFDYNADGRVDATDLTNFQAHYLTVLITAAVPVIPGAVTNRTTLTLRAANAAGCLLSFATLPGLYYKLQSTPSLDQPFADEPGGFIQASQTVMTFTNRPSGPSRFYRVVESATP
jgi:hypothetical protein